MKKLIDVIANFLFKERAKQFEEQFNKLNSLATQMNGLKHYYDESICKQEKIVESLKNTVGNIDVSVDVHEHPRSDSWAAISIQGKIDYIKFINLKDSDLREIQRFLSHFDISKIDATPQTTYFLKANRRKI